MSRWDEATCTEHENVARYDERLNELERPSPTSYSFDNREAVVAFRQLARLRNLVFRQTMRSFPLKADLYDMVDKFAVACPEMTEGDVKLNSTLMDFNELICDLERSPFYNEARRGRRRFRTSLGTYPVSNVKLGVHDGVIGELLDKMFSITPLDYALAGMEDCSDEKDFNEEGVVVMTTEFMDPQLDLVYDINGYAWEFDAELHGVRSEYNYWREIRERMMARNGRVNKAHLILFAAERLSSVLEAIRPLSAGYSMGVEYNIRGYLLAVLNGASELIKTFKLLLSLVDTGGNAMAFDAVTDIGIAVECRESGHRISVTTDETSLSQLIIKAILEGSTRLDTSKQLEEVPFSEYGNNQLLIELFLTIVHSMGEGPASKKEDGLKYVKSLLALSLNTQYGHFREALVARNNGLKQGIDVFLEEGTFEVVCKIVQRLRGSEKDRTTSDIKKILDMEAFGACCDIDEMTWPDEVSDASDGKLYTLKTPAYSSIALKRRGRVVGELSVVDEKFEFHKCEDTSFGLMPIFQGMEGVDAQDFTQVMSFGASVEFEARADGSSIANACLSNVFGIKAAVFVLEHILFGDAAVSEDTSSGYLMQSRRSTQGVQICSFLHPLVTEQLGFYKEKGGEVFSFDMKAGFELDNVVTSRKVAYCKPAEDDVTTWESEVVCMERKFLA